MKKVVGMTDLLQTLVCIVGLTCLPTISCSYLPTGIVVLNDSYYGENFTSLDTFAVTTCQVDFLVNVEATENSTGYVLLDNDDEIVWTGQAITADSNVINGSVTASSPKVQILTTIEMLNNDEAEIFMYVENMDTVEAVNVEIYVDLSSGLRIDFGTLDYIKFLVNNPNSDIKDVYAMKTFTWDVGNLTAGATKNASFVAKVNRNDLTNGVNEYYFELVYEHVGTYTQQFGPLIATVCIDRHTVWTTSILYQHGLTALTFFMALILGAILVVIIVFIIFMIRKKKSVSPSNQEKMMVERSKTIMMNDIEAIRKGGHTINDYSSVSEGDSIIGILSLKDKMQMHREIDSLDIVNTVNIDTSIEKDRNDASMTTTELLIQGLHSNNDIDKGNMESALGNLRKKRAHMDKQHDEDYKREMKKLYKKISAKNRAMMSNIINRQREEKKTLVSNTQNLPPKERNDVLKLMNEQHLSEQNAETFKLKLEQDEETENLRKEFAVRNRMGMKELQQQALNEVIDHGKLTKQQADWLLAEHLKNQKSLEGMYDEEISRQRQVLEEKLARRKALAQAAETEEEDQNDILNTLAGHQITTIEKLKKQQVITPSEAQQYIEQAKNDMIGVKEKMEKERERQEAELHKKLSNLKHKRLADLEKQHDLELKEYDKKCQGMQTQGPIDPVAYASGRLKLQSQQRQEKTTLENELDVEHTDELTKLRNEMASQTEFELKQLGTTFRGRLPTGDRTDDIVQKLMRQHERELAALRDQQERSRREQLERLQERLARSKEEWNQRREAEKVEQQQLREYEEQVVSKLVNSQVSMSDAERDRILKEHEKQMVKLENSLTLNKLRQKRMIEEKLAHKRAQQMEKLQLKQHKEKESQRRIMENNAEDSDEESQRKKVHLMKEHVEQKMAVLQGRKLDWDTELESIRVEMLKERSLALKEQEERLGTLVAGLQMSKAKELAKIEEQQRAIHNLKTSLIDDLNARGVLSDPDTQNVIRRHQEEQEQLNKRLDDQREKQEALLKQKLQARLEQREKSMIKAQDEELKNLVAPNKTAAKIKKMLLIHKHMVAMEKMRNQLEREISQNLEQVRYEYDVCKRKAVQDQEMEFIAGLVRVGTIPKEELEAVLRQLYPNKTEQEFKEIFDKIFDPNLQHRKGAGDNLEHSQLLNRVKFTQMMPQLSRGSSSLSLLSSRTDSLRRNSKKKKSQYPATIQKPQLNEQDSDDGYPRPASRQSYDEYGRPIQKRASIQSYDEYGRPIQKPAFQKSYDDYGRPIQKPAAQQSYDDYGRPIQKASLKESYDDYGRPIQKASLKESYDDYGRPIQKASLKESYDDYGRPIQKASLKESYDDYGRPIQKASLKESYDDYGRPIQKASLKQFYDDYGRPIQNDYRQQEDDYHPQPAQRDSFRKKIQDSSYGRQSYDDSPHPLEGSYKQRSSRDYGKQNGLAFANPVMEDDEDVVSAQYVSNNSNYAQQQFAPSGGKLPPLQADTKKKKKKKFLKKLAHHEHDDDDDL